MSSSIVSRPCAVMDAHLAHDFEALADHVREVVENFGQVAAGFALQHHGGHEELDVDQRNAIGEIEQRVAHGETEFLLLEQLAEFRATGSETSSAIISSAVVKA